jgi:hypothetical protein
MSTSTHWTFPIHLQGKDGQPPRDTDLEASLTASLQKIPGFVRVEKHSGAQQGIYLAHFEPADRTREEIEDAIQASGYTVRQPTPDQEIQPVGTPS